MTNWVSNGCRTVQALCSSRMALESSFPEAVPPELMDCLCGDLAIRPPPGLYSFPNIKK